MTHPNFRTLCAELHKECFALYAEMSASQDFNDAYLQRMDELRDRSSAALAAPQQKPSAKEFFELSRICNSPSVFGRQVLARWGAQVVPVAVAERLPGEGDLKEWPDGKGEPWCWFGEPVSDPDDMEGGHHFQWVQCWPQYGLQYGFTHWLPHWALPLPGARP